MMSMMKCSKMWSNPPTGHPSVNARITIKLFNQMFDGEIPEDDEYETLSGFLYKLTGAIPRLNEEIKYNALQFTILKISPRRVRLVRVRKLPPLSVAASDE